MNSESERSTNQQPVAAVSEADEARSAFEAERKILLNGVAESLSSVVKLMSKANENLNGVDDDSKQVEKVADMWRAAYRRQDDTS